MIIVLDRAGAIALEQPQDFTRFHIEIDAAPAELGPSADALRPVAEIESAELAWVHRHALQVLGQAAAGSEPGAAARWAESADAMLEKAARYGWVREREPAIKSHIIWRNT